MKASHGLDEEKIKETRPARKERMRPNSHANWICLKNHHLTVASFYPGRDESSRAQFSPFQSTYRMPKISDGGTRQLWDVYGPMNLSVIMTSHSQWIFYLISRGWGKAVRCYAWCCRSDSRVVAAVEFAINGQFRQNSWIVRLHYFGFEVALNAFFFRQNCFAGWK